MKFTAFEAAGVKPLMESSPVMRWLYRVFSAQGVSNMLGVVELSIATMIAVRPVWPRVSVLGSAPAVLMFATTLTFLVSLPG